MNRYSVLLSIPGLRSRDLAAMPALRALAQGGETLPLTPSFPCVTCPVQANLTTGVGPEQHGVIANGFFWRETGKVEMWTAWNEVFEAPQIWNTLHQHDPTLTSAVWFPLHSKGTASDYICTPAPIHNPDGSESLWCYTKPTELYGDLRDALGHFPLMNFWGPLAGIQASDWIIDSAVIAAKAYQPRFTYIYLPHLDYAAQKSGPESPQAAQALVDLDAAIARLASGLAEAGMEDILWLAASEYAITEVDGALFPNRTLREAGLLSLREDEGLEYLEPGTITAWALVDHQFAHVFVRDPGDIDRVADLFRNDPDIAEVVTGADRGKLNLNHPRSGEIVLVSAPEKWFAYYWWLDDARAPSFARSVDIHRKPGYDPVEMFINMPERTTPLDASLVKGSHGYPADAPNRQGVLLCSNNEPLAAGTQSLRDVDVASIVFRNFGVDT